MNEFASPHDWATAAEYTTWFRALADPTRTQIVSLPARRAAWWPMRRTLSILMIISAGAPW